MFPLANVDLRLLRVFRVVADCGGFAAVEVELNIGRSTISLHMAELESRLGLRLCRRGRGGFALTDEGRAVYEASERLGTALQNFGADMGAIRGKLTGSLNIGVIDNTVTDPNARLPAALAAFKERAEEVHIALQVTSPNEIERAVLDGRLHVGVSTVHRELSGLTYRPLYSERISLFCGSRNPLFERPPADMGPDGLSIEDLRHTGFVTRGYIGVRDKRSTRLDLQPTATAYTIEGLAILILTGKFIGFLPEHYAARWVGQGLMRPLLPETLAYDSDFKVVLRKGAKHPAVVNAFLEDLLAAYGP